MATTYTKARSSKCSTQFLHSSNPSHSDTAHYLPQNKTPLPKEEIQKVQKVKDLVNF